MLDLIVYDTYTSRSSELPKLRSANTENEIKNTLPLAIVALATNGANAQNTPDKFKHALTVSLIVSSEGKLNDQSSTKNGVLTEVFSNAIVSEKISNKEILDSMVKDGVIQSVKGWSLAVSTEYGEIVEYQLVKKGQDSIDVSGYFASQVNDTISSVKGKTVTGDETLGNSSARIMALGSFGLHLPTTEVLTNGLYNADSTFIVDTQKKIEQSILSSASLTGLLGQATDLTAAYNAELSAEALVAAGTIADDAFVAKDDADAAATAAAEALFSSPTNNNLIAKDKAAKAAKVLADAAYEAAATALTKAETAAIAAATEAEETPKVLLVQGSAKIGTGKKLVTAN